MTGVGVAGGESAYRRGQAGFTLVELAVVLVIAGLLLGGGMYGLDAWRDGNQRSDTALKLTTIEDGLTLYAMTSARLPCPDTDAAPDGQENRSGGSCPVTAGGVPWQDLGIPRAAVRDAWNADIRYVVDAMADDSGGTAPLRCPEDLKNQEGDIKVENPDVPADPKALAAYVLVSAGGNGSPEQDNGGDAADTFKVLAEDGIEDDMLRSRSPGRVLVDGGCKLARTDPDATFDEEDEDEDEDEEAPCVTNVFGGGLSATGNGGIKLTGNPSLNNLPSKILTTTALDVPKHKFQDYSASGVAGDRLTIGSAPSNGSDEDYVAGQWPDVHRTLDASGTFKSLTVTAAGSLTVDNGGSGALTLNVAEDLTVEGAAGLVVNGDAVVYAEDFDVKGSGSVTVNDGVLTVILSGELTVEGAAKLNSGSAAGSGSVVVLAEGDVAVKGSGSADAYIYTNGELEMLGAASVEGSIVADSIEMKGSASFTYSPDAPSNVSDDCP